MKIYVYMQGQRRGPYEKPQLQEMWSSGQLPNDTLYWHDGMSEWAVISDLFADTIMANIAPTSANPDSTDGLQNATTPNQSSA